MLVFRRNYFLLFVLLLITEVLIAVFVHDDFIRPYVGDFLVVILLYCFVRSFFDLTVITTAASVFLFACAVETAQYFNLAQAVGLQNNRLAKIVIGHSFEWLDVLTYALGLLLVIAIEHIAEQDD